MFDMWIERGVAVSVPYCRYVIGLSNSNTNPDISQGHQIPIIAIGPHKYCHLALGALCVVLLA